MLKVRQSVSQSWSVAQRVVCVQCLAAGSNIMNREVESASMRPLAKTLTRHLDALRSLLREQCFRNQNKFTDKVELSNCSTCEIKCLSIVVGCL